jgi:hypothetical protein
MPTLSGASMEAALRRLGAATAPQIAMMAQMRKVVMLTPSTSSLPTSAQAQFALMISILTCTSSAATVGASRKWACAMELIIVVTALMRRTAAGRFK